MSNRRKDTTRARDHAKPEAKGSAADGLTGDSFTPDAMIARLMADDGFRQALRTIYALQRKGQKIVSGSDEEEVLVLYVSLAVRRRERTKGSPKEKFERRWAQDTGKTWKALTEFPTRIRRMAGEVEHVGKSHWLDPKRIASEIPLAMYAKREFPILPTTLRNYADWLEATINRTSTFLKSLYLRVPRGRLSLFTLTVSEQVKLITGRYRDRLVADLLNAADLVLHPGTAKSQPRFFEQDIALQRSRQKRKTPKT